MTPKARVIVAIVRQFNTIESGGYWISAFIVFAPITSLHACMYACYVCVCCVCLFVCCVNVCVCTCVYVCLRMCVCKVYGIYMCVSVCMWEKGMESRGQLCFVAIVRRCMHHKWAPLIVYVWVAVGVLIGCISFGADSFYVSLCVFKAPFLEVRCVSRDVWSKGACPGLHRCPARVHIAVSTGGATPYMAH